MEFVGKVTEIKIGRMLTDSNGDPVESFNVTVEDGEGNVVFFTTDNPRFKLGRTFKVKLTMATGGTGGE